MQETIDMKCAKCDSSVGLYQIRLIPSNRNNVGVYQFPKYIPQIREVCVNGHFQKFVQQTKELIDMANRQLENHSFVVEGGEK